MIRRSCLPLAALMVWLSVAAAQSDQQDPAQPAEKGIGYWISQLDDDHYLRREMASKKLIEAGPAAIDPLMAVIREGDLETIERAVGVIAEIALSRPPNQDGGAFEQLDQLSQKAAGRRASSAKAAVVEIREHRADQASAALAAAGVFVGMDEFAIRAISQSRMLVQIDDKWKGDIESLQWLRWLRGVENARVKGTAVTRDVLQCVAQIPGLHTLAIVDGKVDDSTLEPLRNMKRIHSLEFRYVPLTDEQGDLIAKMPIRVSLNLMGTGISAEKVESMKSALPGLQVDHRQGGFLGVTCLDSFDICEINGVVKGSAAEAAGLIKGDIIVRIGQTPVNRFRDLQQAINQHVPGDQVELTFRRGDKIETVRLKLRKYEES